MKPLAHLNKYLWKYKWRLLIGLFFVTVSNLFGVFPAQIVRHSFDLVHESIKFYQISEGYHLNEAIYSYLGTTLIFFAAIVVSFALLKGFFMFMMRQMIIVASRKMEYDLKNEIYDHFQKLSLGFYRRNNTGDLMARISEDVNKVRMYLGPAIMYTMNLSSLIILVVIIMLNVNPLLTFYVLLPFPFLALSIYVVNSIIQRRSTAIQQQLSHLTTFSQEIFSGIRILKSFAAEKPVKDKFEEECENYRQKSMGMVKVDAVFFPLILLLVGLSTLITLYIGGREVIAGRITPGNVAEFFIYVNLLSWPVASIGWVTSIVQRAAASQRRINELLHSKPEITSPDEPKVSLNQTLAFNNVTFTYPDTGITSLKNINLSIPPQQTIGIIGRTGAGKSSLADLVLRLYDPTEGEITVGPHRLDKINLDYHRQQIGYVPQEDFLFSDSIANNILFSFPESIRVKDIYQHPDLLKSIEKVSEIAGIYEDIVEMPEGFNTKLGERGVSLSGGQKQRVGIARALICDPTMLILDDCFSAIDTYTEARILEKLPEVLGAKTTLLISHRISTVKNCDHIVVLDKGEIIERGQHNDLVKNGGYYQYLYEKQLSEQEFYQSNL